MDVRVLHPSLIIRAILSRLLSLLYLYDPDLYREFRLRRIFAAARNTQIYSGSALGAEDFLKMPVIDKTFINNFPRFHRFNRKLFPKRVLRFKHTTGSTGTPFFLAQDKRYDLLRLFWPSDATCKSPWPRYFSPNTLMLIYLRGKSSRFGERGALVPSITIKDFLSDPTKNVRDISRGHYRGLRTFPSILVKLMETISANSDIPRLRFSYVVTTGEMLTPDIRAACKDYFGAEVFDEYSCEEFGSIGIECGYHDGLHLKTESFIMEILNDRNEHVADGESGRIVITTFDNEVMPLIRYDTGDLGRFFTTHCRCGSLRPRFAVDGRVMFIFRVGKKSFNYFDFYPILRSFSDHIAQYQIVCRKDDVRVEIDIIPLPGFAEKKTRLQREIRDLLGKDVAIVIKTVREIGRNGRKFHPFKVI